MIAPVLVMLWCAAVAVAVLSLGCVLLVGYFIVVAFRKPKQTPNISGTGESLTHIMGGKRD